jgi:translocation and assembly module TamB
MAPQGRLSARVDLARGGMLSGNLHLHNAALRPIDPLGVVQEINADLALQGRQLEIKSWSAKLGGEPVEMRGTIEVPRDGKPRVAVALQGKNLPLVRRTGLIVRSDIDLKATTRDNDVTEVTGLVNLHDSFVLADLSMLRPTGTSTARQQPPFFSVEVEPFRDWTLAVDLRGSHAVKIRMPVFTGEASARFRLSGTLGEPRAVGELTVDEGRVLFPFATFDVQRGDIRLSEADPYHPQLNVDAQYRYHDYLVRLEARGPLESPRIELSSSPSLDSTQLLLMVTSGQSPESDQAGASGTQRLARLGTYLGQHMLLGNDSDAGRIEFSSGARVSRDGRETYEFTYRLNEKWALVGEYDEYDEYNAGVKWRAYVQEGDKSEKK